MLLHILYYMFKNEKIINSKNYLVFLYLYLLLLLFNLN